MEAVQLFLTEDDIAEAKRMFGWRFWYDGVLCSAATMGCAIALVMTRHPATLFLLVIFGVLALLNIVPRMREHKAFKDDLEMRLASVLLAAPQRVWRPENFFCYLRINGVRIRIPWERYYELREANLIRVIFLPTSRVAVRIEVAPGLGIVM